MTSMTLMTSRLGNLWTSCIIMTTVGALSVGCSASEPDNSELLEVEGAYFNVVGQALLSQVESGLPPQGGKAGHVSIHPYKTTFAIISQGVEEATTADVIKWVESNEDGKFAFLIAPGGYVAVSKEEILGEQPGVTELARTPFEVSDQAQSELTITFKSLILPPETLTEPVWSVVGQSLLSEITCGTPPQNGDSCISTRAYEATFAIVPQSVEEVSAEDVVKWVQSSPDGTFAFMIEPGTYAAVSREEVLGEEPQHARLVRTSFEVSESSQAELAITYESLAEPPPGTMGVGN